jgi:hypothetical protein
MPAACDIAEDVANDRGMADRPGAAQFGVQPRRCRQSRLHRSAQDRAGSPRRGRPRRRINH